MGLLYFLLSSSSHAVVAMNYCPMGGGGSLKLWTGFPTPLVHLHKQMMTGGALRRLQHVAPTCCHRLAVSPPLHII